MLYALLIIIAIGVLLASRPGQVLLGWIIVLSIGGALLVGGLVLVVVFWDAVVNLAILFGVIAAIVAVVFWAQQLQEKYKNREITAESVKEGIKSTLKNSWAEWRRSRHAAHSDWRGSKTTLKILLWLISPILLVAVVYVLLWIWLLLGSGTNPGAMVYKLPSFTEYPATLTQKEPASLKLNSHPVGSSYKTAVSNAYEASINFGGKYVIATWGCGTNCQRGAIVDIETGIIVGELPFVAENGISFVATSTLLIENPPESTRDDSFGSKVSRYWLWDGERFKELASYIVSDSGIEAAPPPTGPHTEPEWQWKGDCVYLDGLTACK